MNKKEYPVFEDKDSGIVKEPVSAMEYQKEMLEISDFEANVPVAGPKTYEEALSDISQSETDFSMGRCFSWDDVRQTIEERIKSYAN